MQHTHESLIERDQKYAWWHSKSWHTAVHFLILTLVASAYTLVLQSSVDDIVATQESTFAAAATAKTKVVTGNDWKSADESRRTGNVQSPNDILEVGFSFDVDRTPALTITTMRTLKGYAPELQEFEEPYQLQLLDGAGTVLTSMPFDIELVVYDPPREDNELTNDHALLLKKTDFVVTTEWKALAVSLQVLSPDEAIIATSTLKQIQSIQNKPNFRSKPGKDVKPSAVTSFIESLLPYAHAATNEGVLDITFIGEDYGTDMTKFHADVNRFTQHLLTYQPFKSRATQIMFHYVDNTKDLGCSYSGRLLTCSRSIAVQEINTAGAPYDQVVVIVNNSTYGGSGGGAFSVAYNGDLGDEVFVHELGHSLGGLQDEYVNITSNGTLSNNVYANCYAGLPPAASWSGVVSASDYQVGCNYQNWYRSSPSSIMRELGSKYFNSVSQALLNARIDYYTAPSLDTTAPKTAINAPLSGTTLTGTITVTASATDNVGVARVELWKDKTLYKVVYASPYSFTWDTAGEKNEAHTLETRAYDAAGNVGISPLISVTTKNGTETMPPTVSITSVESGALLSGITTVYISATDDSGAISKVELLRNDTVLGSDTTSPYSISWDTNTETNGSYSLQAKAYDPSGNVGISESVAVSVSNIADTTAPEVLITKPLGGSRVPSKGTAKISVVASDAGGIKQIEILLDNKSIKTCSDSTSCTGSISVKSLVNGVHTIIARATDTAGNNGETTINIIK